MPTRSAPSTLSSSSLAPLRPSDPCSVFEFHSEFFNGRVLAKTLATVRPEMKVLYTSGYSSDVCIEQGELEAGCPLLEISRHAERFPGVDAIQHQEQVWRASRLAPHPAET